MTPNVPFNKAVSLLAHPAALLAMAALALNDFVLKAAYPSWLTGKLSDFALLFFLPYLLLAAGTWALPARRRERAAEAVFGGVAVGFALLKLSPAAGEGLHWLTGLVGLPLYTRPDPSDLPALAALVPAWRLWRGAQPARCVSWRLAVLPLAALLTLADAAAPEYGITCFRVGQGQIAAATTFGREYASRDGGLTWGETQEQGGYGRCDLSAGQRQAVMVDPGGAVQYRFEPGGVIERSSDGGQTWAVTYAPPHLNQARRAYAEKTLADRITYRAGPLSAMEDPATGNVLFAMGMEGVLVRSAAGEWIWSDVGKYARSPVERIPAAGYSALLLGEGVLGLAAGLLGFSALALGLHRRGRNLRIAKVVVGGLGWLAALLIFPPALTSGAYSGVFVGFSLAAVGLYALLSALEDVIALSRAHAPGGWCAGGFGLLAGALFLAAFVLWAAEALPDYWIAAGVGGGLALAALAAGAVRLRKTRAGKKPPAA